MTKEMRPLVVGCPREIKEQENRVALTPPGAAQLARRGVRVLVETRAGRGADYDDDEYREAGAEVVDSARAVFEQARLIVKVKEPQPTELALLEPRHLLFTYLHLAADRRLTEALVATGCTALAYETVRVGERLPLLEPMSEVAGRMSVIVGAYFLAEHAGGAACCSAVCPGCCPGGSRSSVEAPAASTRPASRPGSARRRRSSTSTASA